MIETIKNLFIVRDDVFAIQLDDGRYIKKEEPLTDEIIRKHLSGEITIGVYQLSKDSKVKWICFDVDSTVDDAKKIYNYIKEKPVYNGSVGLEYTGGRGYHIWIFLDKLYPSDKVRNLGFKILENINISCELFPKQDKAINYGNLVKLPLGIHRKYNKRSFFIEPPTLELIHPVNIPTTVFKAIEQEKSKLTIPTDDGCVALQKIQSGVEEGIRNEACFWLARLLRKFQFNREICFYTLKLWNNLNNPPLSALEIANTVNSVYSRKYGVSWFSIKKNSLLSQLCEGCENCVFEKKTKKKRKEKSPLVKPLGVV